MLPGNKLFVHWTTKKTVLLRATERIQKDTKLLLYVLLCGMNKTIYIHYIFCQCLNYNSSRKERKKTILFILMFMSVLFHFQ